MIPQANPGAGYRALKNEIDAAVARALSSGWYILGNELRAFEAEFAAWLGVPSVIGCGNGTDAIALALRGLGIGPGCTVVTVSHTAVATVAAIEMAGATPLLIDIDPVHYTMDPDALRPRAATTTARPAADQSGRAGASVWPAGRPGPDRSALPDARRGADRGLRPGPRRAPARHSGSARSAMPPRSASTRPRTSARWVTAARWRYPIPQWPTRIAALRQYGWHKHYISDEVGVNSRLDEVQAAILRVKLAHLDSQNARRADIAEAYTAALGGRPAAAAADSAKTSATSIISTSRDRRIGTGFRRY